MSASRVTEFSSGAKNFAAALVAVSGATLILRIVLKSAETESVLGAISYLSQFFTILTNTLVFGVMLAIVLGKWIAPRITQSLVIAIVGVGIVYHVALAHLLDLSGLALLADHGVHTFVPAMTLVWWLFFAPKNQFQLRDAIAWIVWPVAYCGYILIRASFSGFYPYPFLNLPELGVLGLVQSILLLCLAFIVIGFALVGLSKLVGQNSRVAS